MANDKNKQSVEQVVSTLKKLEKSPTTGTSSFADTAGVSGTAQSGDGCKTSEMPPFTFGRKK